MGLSNHNHQGFDFAQSTTSRALSNALKELLERKLITKDQHSSYSNCLVSYARELGITSGDEFTKHTGVDLIGALLEDQKVALAFKTALNSYKPSFALKTNKLPEILDGAVDMYDKYGDFLFKLSNDSKDGFKIDSLGASYKNFIFTAVIKAIAIIKGFEHIAEIAQINLTDCSLSNDKSRHLDTTTLQGVGLPKDFRHEGMPKLKNWFFYRDLSDSNLPKTSDFPIQGDIVIPTQGYAFGGSRADKYNYQLPGLNNEDCSSAVQKWAGIEKEFSTWCMEQAWKYYFEAQCHDGVCKQSEPYDNLGAILAKLHPKAEEGFGEGDIFVSRSGSGGHTGVVKHKYDDSSFESISYNRDIPHFEGLIYQNVTIIPTKTYYFFEEIG
jgi:hypothetical protein